jgi:hypothetical protein
MNEPCTTLPLVFMSPPRSGGDLGTSCEERVLDREGDRPGVARGRGKSWIVGAPAPALRRPARLIGPPGERIDYWIRASFLLPATEGSGPPVPPPAVATLKLWRRTPGSPPPPPQPPSTTALSTERSRSAWAIAAGTRSNSLDQPTGWSLRPARTPSRKERPHV